MDKNSTSRSDTGSQRPDTAQGSSPKVDRLRQDADREKMAREENARIEALKLTNHLIRSADSPNLSSDGQVLQKAKPPEQGSLEALRREREARYLAKQPPDTKKEEQS